MPTTKSPKRPKVCLSCEHVHAVGTECQRRTPAAMSTFSPTCGCRVGR